MKKSENFSRFLNAKAYYNLFLRRSHHYSCSISWNLFAVALVGCEEKFSLIFSFFSFIFKLICRIIISICNFLLSAFTLRRNLKSILHCQQNCVRRRGTEVSRAELPALKQINYVRKRHHRLEGRRMGWTLVPIEVIIEFPLKHKGTQRATNRWQSLWTF